MSNKPRRYRGLIYGQMCRKVGKLSKFAVAFCLQFVYNVVEVRSFAQNPPILW